MNRMMMIDENDFMIIRHGIDHDEKSFLDTRVVMMMRSSCSYLCIT